MSWTGSASSRGDLREAAVEAEVVAGAEVDALAGLGRETADAVELALVDPAGIGEALVGEDGLHHLHAQSPISSSVRPLLTDSGWVETGSRRASAPSSRRLISSHCGLAPPPVRWSVQPPRSFSPSSQNERWPRSMASSGGPSVSGRHVPASHTITRPAP